MRLVLVVRVRSEDPCRSSAHVDIDDLYQCFGTARFVDGYGNIFDVQVALVGQPHLLINIRR